MDLRLENLTKRFGDRIAVEVPSLTIGAGEFFTFVGPSGCGKTTILNLIAGLEEPTSGRLWIGDRLLNDLPPHKRDIAFVFQSYALYPHRDVAENLGFPLQIAKTPTEAIRTRVQEVAALLGLVPLLNKYPRQLSGGERQRVALGRAIVRQPRLFLFDEPLSNLDAPLRALMRKELKHLHRQLGTTFVYVTHDQEEALSLSGRVAIMREGRIQQCDEPNTVYECPANRFVASFFGAPQMNFLEGTATVSDRKTSVRIQDVQLETTDHALPESSSVIVGIRPEDLRISSAAVTESLAGRVALVEPHGSQTHLEIKIDGGSVTVIANAKNLFSENQQVWITPTHIHLFDPETGKRLSHPEKLPGKRSGLAE